MGLWLLRSVVVYKPIPLLPPGTPLTVSRRARLYYAPEGKWVLVAASLARRDKTKPCYRTQLGSHPVPIPIPVNIKQKSSNIQQVTNSQNNEHIFSLAIHEISRHQSRNVPIWTLSDSISKTKGTSISHMRMYSTDSRRSTEPAS